MSTISSTALAAFTPPKQRLLDAIAAKAEAGRISATDKTALDTAVGTIDASVSGASGSSRSPSLDPSQMKSRIDSLIGEAVSNGTLTDEQATTLKDLFGQGGPQGGGKVAGGPPPGPPPSGSLPPSDDSASDKANAGTATTDAASVSDLLTTFMKQLQATQGQGGAYTAGGSSGSRVASALLVNFEA